MKKATLTIEKVEEIPHLKQLIVSVPDELTDDDCRLIGAEAIRQFAEDHEIGDWSCIDDTYFDPDTDSCIGYPVATFCTGHPEVLLEVSEEEPELEIRRTEAGEYILAKPEVMAS